MDVVAVKAEKRTELGKKGAAQVRRAGRIPCVLYDLNQVIHFSAEFNEIRHLIYTPSFKLAEIELDGKKYKCILKDYQMHPVTDAVTHIDFLNLVEGQPIKIEVPVRFTGQAPGVKAGGKLQRTLRRVKLKTTPEHLVDELTVDVSGLEMSQSIRVRDIETKEGIEILTAPGTPIGVVATPRSLRSAAAKAAGAALPGDEVEAEGAEGAEEEAAAE